jgi:hypothetical protein
MSRLVVLLSLATLSLLAACVDLKSPSKVSLCEQNNSCIDGTGGATGGKGGMTAGSGGSRSQSADAGASDTPSGGRGGSGGATGGSQGSGGTGGIGGTGGDATGGTTGGSSGSADAGTDPTLDAEIDKPVGPSDVPFDTYAVSEVSKDTWIGPDALKPDTGSEPDASPDISPDRLPDPPDTGFDAPTCISSLKSNGYALTTPTDAGINACGECKENGSSKEAQCKSMVDCLQSAWVCKPSAGCWLSCLNAASADSVVDACVKTLVTRSCPGL